MFRSNGALLCWVRHQAVGCYPTAPLAVQRVSLSWSSVSESNDVSRHKWEINMKSMSTDLLVFVLRINEHERHPRISPALLILPTILQINSEAKCLTLWHRPKRCPSYGSSTIPPSDRRVFSWATRIRGTFNFLVGGGNLMRSPSRNTIGL